MTRYDAITFVAACLAVVALFASAAWVGVERTRTARAAIVCGQQPNQ